MTSGIGRGVGGGFFSFGDMEIPGGILGLQQWIGVIGVNLSFLIYFFCSFFFVVIFSAFAFFL
jgi:hypothetical protein